MLLPAEQQESLPQLNFVAWAGGGRWCLVKRNGAALPPIAIAKQAPHKAAGCLLSTVAMPDGQNEALLQLSTVAWAGILQAMLGQAVPLECPYPLTPCLT